MQHNEKIVLAGLIVAAIRLTTRAQESDTPSSGSSPKLAVASYTEYGSPIISYKKGEGVEHGFVLDQTFNQRMFFDPKDKSTGPQLYGLEYKYDDKPVVTAGGFGTVSVENAWHI
jgi:hypothetical protein